jgi:hypothetical protein
MSQRPWLPIESLEPSGRGLKLDYSILIAAELMGSNARRY